LALAAIEKPGTPNKVFIRNQGWYSKIAKDNLKLVIKARVSYLNKLNLKRLLYFINKGHHPKY
jgi:hypothetical protein